MKIKTKSNSKIIKTTATNQAFVLSDTQIVYYHHLKKIEKKIDIPEGLIVQGNIVNMDELLKLMRPWINSLSVTQGVTVCLPEDPVITKTLTVNKESSDLNEVVLWEIQKYLPLPIDKMVVDWQYVTPKENKTKVLVAAMPLSVAEAYFELFGSLSIRVLDFDAPSLAMGRAIGQKPHPAIAIAKIGNNYVFIGNLAPLQSKATSIIDINAGEDQLNTTFHHLYEYLTQTGEVQVSNVYLDSNVDINLKIHNHNLNINKLENLLLNSVATKSIYTPLTVTTINLLPNKYISNSSPQDTLPVIRLLTQISLVWMILIFFMLLPFIYRSWNLYSQAVKMPIAPFRENPKVKTFTEQIKLTNQVGQERSRAVEILEYINKMQVPDLVITSFKMNTPVRSITLTGYGPSQTEVLDYKNILEADTSQIESIKVPLSIYEKKTPMPFTFTITYTPSNIK